MNWQIVFICTTIFFAPNALTRTYGADPATEVNWVFATYRESILDGDGIKAWNVLDRSTQEFFGKSVVDALSLSEEDFDKLPLFFQKIVVVRLRLDFTAEQLKGMSGKDAFTAGVKKGYIDAATARRIKTLDKIDIKDDVATAFLPAAPSIPVFYFVNENGVWKLSITKNFALIEKTIQALRKQQGVSEREFMLQMLSLLHKKKVDPAIFKGPRT